MEELHEYVDHEDLRRVVIIVQHDLVQARLGDLDLFERGDVALGLWVALRHG